MEGIEQYSLLMQNLSVKITNGERKPNKAIMLLSVIDLIRCNYISENKILLDDTIQEAFEYNWRKFVNDKPPTAWTPFWHLHKEPFWHFCAKAGYENRINSLAPKGGTASIGQMRKAIEYAWLDEKLFYLLRNNKYRTQIRELLIKTYISISRFM